MAEFTRKSGRRNLESIDTRKASKQDVYAFYERTQKQLKQRGEKLKNKIDSKAATKADIVKALEQDINRLNQIERERSLMQDYEKIKKKILTMTGTQANEEFTKFESKLARMEKAGKIDLKRFSGGSFYYKYQTEEIDAEGMTKTTYHGRFAHDKVKAWIDEGLLDPEEYADSDDMFIDMDMVAQNDEKFDMFQRTYEGDEKEGSAAYYDEFEEFLVDIINFFDYLNSDEYQDTLDEGEEPPEFGSPEFDDAFNDWRNSV